MRVFRKSAGGGILTSCRYNFLLWLQFPYFNQIPQVNNKWYEWQYTSLLRAEIIWVPKGVERSDTFDKCLIPLYHEDYPLNVVVCKPTANVKGENIFSGTRRDVVGSEKCKFCPDTKTSFTSFSKACPCHSQHGCIWSVELSRALCTHERKGI